MARFTCLLAAACLTLAGLPAVAQTWPAKPIRIIVPFPPGGGVDIVSRALAEKVSPRLGQPMPIDNRPGAGTTIGLDAAVRSAPDGYTVLMAPIGAMAITTLLHPKLAFDVRRDLAAVSRVGRGTVAFIVPQGSRANSVREFVALAKASPGRMTYASSGTGGLIHLTGEMFKRAAGVDLLHVPYKGTTQIIPDILDGRIDLALDSLPAYLVHLKSGKVRALAVAGASRSSLLPDLPTMAEAGVPGVVSATDYALYAPAGVPREVIALLNREVNAVLRDADLRAKLAAAGIEVSGSTPEALAAELAEEFVKWAKVIREAGVKPE
jgi:tripartite-type tricarboxylate transporter receptor subunit TctC